MTLRSIVAAAVALFWVGLWTSAAQAQSAPGLQRLTLAYDGRLYIKVLDFRFDAKIAPSGYNASVAMNSSGILAAFKHFDVQAASQGPLEAGAARPGAFSYTNHDGKRVRHVTAAWEDGDVRTASTPAFSNMGDPPATPAQKLAAADPVLQLLKIALTPAQKIPCAGETRFFDGKQLYALDLIPAGGGEVSGRGQTLGLINPVRCTVRYREIAGFKRKAPNKRDQGLNSPISIVFAELGQAGPWVIASLEAETKLGPARIELREAQVTRGHS